MRLTKKFTLSENGYYYYSTQDNEYTSPLVDKLGQLEDIEEELGIDLITFLKGIDPNTCFMEITKDKDFYLCGDAYCGNFSKEGLLEFIQRLLFMYWALIKEGLKK